MIVQNIIYFYKAFYQSVIKYTKYTTELEKIIKRVIKNG